MKKKKKKKKNALYNDNTNKEEEERGAGLLRPAERARLMIPVVRPLSAAAVHAGRGAL